jgi:metal transporter CNNM
MPPTAPNTYLSKRPLVLGLSKIIFLALAQTPIAQAAPLYVSTLLSAQKEEEGKSPDDASLWAYLGFAAFLVLLGGAFAGLTIALMGQVSILALRVSACTDKRTG